MAAALLVALSACGGGSSSSGVVPAGPATPAAERPAARFLTPPATPGPVVFPRDDGPHQDLTEWWYYTGHLQAADGRLFGFEFVIFQSRRFGYPAYYASHFAVSDISAGSFHFADRSQSAGQPSGGPVIDLAVGDWSLSGSGPVEQIHAALDGDTLDLQVSATKPPVLHNEVGYFEYAPATGSYYYSRTRMAAAGRLTVAGQPLEVRGEAWMDHQWGNFLVAGRGGWDWFSIQLNDDRELMLWHTRDAGGQIIFGDATLVAPDGSTRHLRQRDFQIEATGSWTSPHTGATYPSGWRVRVPSENLTLTLTPQLQDQELYGLQSTGIAYWEGAVAVTASGSPAGLGYVELTGYAPGSPPPAP